MIVHKNQPKFQFLNKRFLNYRFQRIVLAFESSNLFVLIIREVKKIFTLHEFLLMCYQT